MACAQCHYAVHPTARLLRALIAPLAINHDQARTPPQIGTTSATWRLSVFELSVTHRPQVNRFHFPSSPFKHAQRRRAPSRINSRAALPHTYPSHGHVPDGTPSPSVCAMDAFVGINPCRPSSFCRPSGGRRSATPHLATSAERRGAGRNRARQAHRSTRQVRASRTSQLVPAPTNRCRYS